MYKILGLQFSKGEYQGKQYDNVKLHIGKKITNDDYGYGYITQMHSIKRTLLIDILDKYKLSINSLVGLDFSKIYFDEYQKISDLVK